MGNLLEQVQALAAITPDEGYINEKDLVQNMRQMTALANQIVVEFSKVEPSMQTIYNLRDDFENLAERTITIVNNYENEIHQTNETAQQIISNLTQQTDKLRQDIEEILNVGSNFESISEEIHVLLTTNETVISLTEDFQQLVESTGIEFIKSGTSSWVEPRDRVKGRLYAEVQNAINFGREPYTHPEIDIYVGDHDGPIVKKFTIAPTDNGTYEAGTSATITSISATIEARSGHFVDHALLIDDDDTVLAVYDWSKNSPKLTSAAVNFSITGNLSISRTHVYKIIAFDETGASDAYFSNPQKFVYPFYHGSMPGGTTSVTPDSITARIRSGNIVMDVIRPTTIVNLVFTFTAAADVFLYPKEYGRLESLTSISGDVLAQYDVIEMNYHGTDYLCYLNSGAVFSENNYQLRLKFPDPAIDPPYGVAKIKPLAEAYIAEGTGFTSTGINVEVTDTNAPIKEIRVYDGDTLVANANHSNFGIPSGFTIGKLVLSWDSTKFAGFKRYRVEIEDTDGRIGKIMSSAINFVSPTYFRLILGNDTDKFELPMTDENLRAAIRRSKDLMVQMFPAPMYSLKESHGKQAVSGGTRVIRDVLIFPTSFGAPVRILDNTTDRASDYVRQRVSVDGIDYWVYAGPAPTPDSADPSKGIYNRTFIFK